MTYYMFQASFTPEAWGKMVRQPQNREAAMRPAFEKLGGRMLGYWFAFGESDVVVPVLMTAEESMEAMRKAGAGNYRAPS